MKSLTILTTNPEKQAQARTIFNSSGIALEFVVLETPEIQAYTCEEVATASALFAYEHLQRPVAVTDAGYFIRALHGFPGPFLKYVNTMLTSDDLLRVMSAYPDRRIDLVEAVVYVDAQRVPRIFTSAIQGLLAMEVRGEGRLFDRLFIPDGYTQTISELGEEKMRQVYIEQFTHWHRLKEFLVSISQYPEVSLSLF